MKQGYGVLYEELRMDSGKKILLVPGLFLLRRVMLAIAVCVVAKQLIWQVFILAGQVITQIMLIGQNVYSLNSRRRMEYFNEIIILCVLYTILTFSPWVSDLDVRFYVGYWTVSFIILHLAVNMYIILRHSYFEARFKCRRRYARKAMRRQRKDIS